MNDTKSMLNKEVFRLVLHGGEVKILPPNVQLFYGGAWVYSAFSIDEAFDYASSITRDEGLKLQFHVLSLLLGQLAEAGGWELPDLSSLFHKSLLRKTIIGVAGARIRQGVTMRLGTDGKYYPYKGEQP